MQKLGRWWRKYGYDGPPYCQRCADTFSNHVMRKLTSTGVCSVRPPPASPRKRMRLRISRTTHAACKLRLTRCALLQHTKLCKCCDKIASYLPPGSLAKILKS